MRSCCIALIVAFCTLAVGSAPAADKPDATTNPAAQIEKIEFLRKDKGKWHAMVTLKEPMSRELGRTTMRFLFVKADADLAPKSAIDVDAKVSAQTRSVVPWSSTGGLLTRARKEAGFVLDLTPLREWPTSVPTEIDAPLDASTLLDGMAERLEVGKGTLYVAFVKLAPDGSTKVPVSNTVTAKVE